MDPLSVYKKNSSLETTIGSMPRVDVLLSLYDRAIQHLEDSIAALRLQDTNKATRLTMKARLTVLGLIAGVIPNSVDVADNLLRLYQFVLSAAEDGKLEKMQGGVNVLKTLREGFEGARSEAIRLERTGAIAPVTFSSSMTVVA
jgi:flagellar protein FliS